MYLVQSYRIIKVTVVKVYLRTCTCIYILYMHVYGFFFMCIYDFFFFQLSYPRMSTPTMSSCGSEDSFIVRRDDRLKVKRERGSERERSPQYTCMCM